MQVLPYATDDHTWPCMSSYKNHPTALPRIPGLLAIADCSRIYEHAMDVMGLHYILLFEAAYVDGPSLYEHFFFRVSPVLVKQSRLRSAGFLVAIQLSPYEIFNVLPRSRSP